MIHLGHRHAERGQDHDVPGVDVRIARDGVLFLGQDADVHRLHAHVHVGVVDDLARQEDAAVRELLARLVRVLDGAVDAVAAKPNSRARRSSRSPARAT